MNDERKITIQWGDVAQRYMVMVFRDHWEETDLLQALADFHKLNPEKKRHLMLVDFRIRSIPSNFFPLMRYSLTIWQPKPTRLVVVGEGQVWKSLYPLIGSAIEALIPKVTFVENMDEGQMMIQQILRADDETIRRPFLKQDSQTFAGKN